MFGSPVLFRPISSLSPGHPLPVMQGVPPTDVHEMYSFHYGPIMLSLWNLLSSFLDFFP